MEMVGVIPAAGWATRLEPLRGSKELIDVGGYTVSDARRRARGVKTSDVSLDVGTGDALGAVESSVTGHRG